MQFLRGELEDFGIGLAVPQVAPAHIGLEQAEQVAPIDVEDGGPQRSRAQGSSRLGKIGKSACR